LTVGAARLPCSSSIVRGHVHRLNAPERVNPPALHTSAESQ
jgi:hypothetical protein